MVLCIFCQLACVVCNLLYASVLQCDIIKMSSSGRGMPSVGCWVVWFGRVGLGIGHFGCVLLQIVEGVVTCVDCVILHGVDVTFCLPTLFVGHFCETHATSNFSILTLVFGSSYLVVSGQS